MKEKIRILILTGVLLAGTAGREARAAEDIVRTTEITGITFQEAYEKEKDTEKEPEREEPGGMEKSVQESAGRKESLPQTGEGNERSRQTAGLVIGGSLMAYLCRNKKR